MVGFISTNLLRAFMSEPNTEAYAAGRVGKPEDIASLPFISPLLQPHL
ncbi:hypothetical protein [Coleofasciculus chthonoplastes]